MSQPPLSVTRVATLDGLRGVAAFVVIISHVIAGFFPALYFGAEGNAGVAIQDAIAKSPAFVLYSGTFAVYVFFVLSGFVIAASATRAKCGLPLLAATRYLRLAVPITVSVLLAFALNKLFSDVPQRAGAAVGNNFWLKFMYQPLGVPLRHALGEAFYGVFVSGLSYFNNVLWTMRIELAGSLGIYALYSIFGRRARVAALVIATLWLAFGTREWPASLLGFTLGALLFEARQHGWPHPNALAAAILIPAGLFFGGLPYVPAQGTLYEAIAAAIDRVSPVSSTMRTLGAVALLTGILCSRRSQTFLDARLPQFLGRISFALYLVHLPLLCFGLSELYLHFGRYDPRAMALSIACYIAVSIGLAYAFTLWIDEPTVRILGRVKKIGSAWPHGGCACGFAQTESAGNCEVA